MCTTLLPGPSHDGPALGAIVVAAPHADIAGFGLAEIKQSLAGALCPVLWLLGQPGSPEESTIPGVQIRHCPLILQNLLSFVDMVQLRVAAA